MESIDKLKEKVAKDPSSKLFVPLAEEYRKAGKLDEAINVLKSGIERQPSYMSARVALSKIYLEKGMLNEARDELEKVVKSIPDNLFAQRKLADIYKQLGDKERAISQYKVVLRLNPLDEEALNILKELEGPVSEEEPVSTESMLETTTFAEPEGVEIESVPIEATAFETPPVEEAAEEAVEEEKETEKPEEVAEGVFVIETPEEVSIEGLSFEGIPEEETPEYTIETEEIGGVTEEAIPEFKGSFEEFEKEEPQIEPIGRGFELPESTELELPESTELELPKEEPPEFEIPEEAVLPEVEPSMQIGEEPLEFEIPEVETPPPLVEEVDTSSRQVLMAVSEGISLSDIQVQKGDFSGAIRTLSALLRENPGHREVLQRLHELKSLLRLLGKDKEIIIGRLEGLLEGIRKARDEFFRSA